MGHDLHFLERTVDTSRNLPLPAVERAMLLYHDPELLRFIFEQARLPEGLEDVAIALTHEERPPHLLVHRSGHFRTVLGAGMPVTAAFILTRQQFDGQVERMADLRERLATAERLSGEQGGPAKLMTCLTKAGCYLSREEFVAVSHLQPLLRDYFVAVFDELARVQEGRRLALRRAPLKKLGRDVDSVLHDYWNGYFLLGHLALLAVMDRHRHAQPLRVDAERLYFFFPRRLFLLGTIGSALKAGWVAGELGKDILGDAKRKYAAPDDPWEVVEGAITLLGIASRRPKTRAEITKILDTPTRAAGASERAAFEKLLELMRQAFSGLDAQDPVGEHLWTHLAAQAFQRCQRQPTNDAMPPEFGVAAACHSRLSLRDNEGLGLLFFGVSRVAKGEPKHLYFPDAALSSMRREWQPRDALALLELQEALYEKPRPAQAAVTPGRNDPCSCGSGKKFKRCHGNGSTAPAE